MRTYTYIDNDKRARMLDLLRQGVNYADIASELGISYSSVAHHARNAGFGRRQPSHKAALPWTLAPRHKLCMPAQRLRDLSRLSQGLDVDAYKRAGAIRWAQDLVAKGLDVAYEVDAPPSEFSLDGGFYTVAAASADPRETHIGRVLQAAMDGYKGN
ncbi:winged helix-turn-helix domain-containing protein [Nonomuraea roseola]|uniref:winged helix-turn-helix domain-containing protein n=1 Tax=Nonomuraea roseola TaxID=46179 RepID=UPI003D156BEA